MRLAIYENIMTPGGHEVDFDRIIVEEMRSLGHEVSFYVPEDFVFSFDYGVPVKRLSGSTVSYTGVTGLKKLLFALRREINRQRHYRTLFRAAEHKEFDALIVPTSTYRYLRAIAQNDLRRSPVPVVFILHGINPAEAPRFFRQAKRLSGFPNIRMAVLLFTKDVLGRRENNVFPMYPPTYTPRDISYQSRPFAGGTLNIGFFGQYRREKRLEDLLNTFLAGNYTRPVKLSVQGSTMHPEDATDFERIIKAYSGYDNISFLHQGLIGAKWQEAIAQVDALLLPYSAPRYRYHWGGMLFTAIGYEKPVIASDDMNPEVFQSFKIGEVFPSGDQNALRSTLEKFINNFDASHYASALHNAATTYSPANFAANLLKILQA